MGTRPILDAYDRPKMLSLARRTFVSKSSTTFARSLSVSAARYAGGKVTVIQGEGAKAGTVPSDIEQATGLERMELLGKMRGEDPFRMEPLEVPYMGTPKNPVKVYSLVRHHPNRRLHRLPRRLARHPLVQHPQGQGLALPRVRMLLLHRLPRR